MDKDSGKLWQDYIDFIKTGPGVIGGSDWQDKSKMDALRSAYQRAIAVPTSSLNALWKEYDVFETQSNKVNVSAADLNYANCRLTGLRAGRIFKRGHRPI